MRRSALVLLAVVPLAAATLGSTSASATGSDPGAPSRAAIASAASGTSMTAAAPATTGPVADGPSKKRGAAPAAIAPATTKATRTASTSTRAAAVAGTTVTGAVILPLADGIGDSVDVTIVSDVRTDTGAALTSAAIVVRDAGSALVRSLGTVDGTATQLDPLCDIVVEYCDYQVTWHVTWDGRNDASAASAVGDYTITADGSWPATIQVRNLALVAVNGPAATTYLTPNPDGNLDQATVTGTGVTYGDVAIPTTGSAALVRASDSGTVQTWTFDVAATTHDVLLENLPLGDYTLTFTLTYDAVDVTQSFAVSSVRSEVLSTVAGRPWTIMYPAIDGYRDRLPITVTSTTAPHAIIPVTGFVRVKLGTVKKLDIPVIRSNQTVLWNGRVGGVVVPGTYTLTPMIKGAEGGWAYGPSVSVVVARTVVTKVVLTASPTTVYPVVDGYRDKMLITVGGLQSTGLYGVGSLVATVKYGTRVAAKWTYANTTRRILAWNGRLAGAVVPGYYTITVTAKGPEGVAKSLSLRVAVSGKKLVTKTAIQTKTYTGAYALDSCLGSGYFTCENGHTAYIGGTTYTSVTEYYNGASADDYLWAANSLPLPAGTTSFRLRMIGETYDAVYHLGPCYSDATDVADCPAATDKWFSLWNEGTFDYGWTTVGARDRWADFYIATGDWGFLSVARFIIDAKYTYKVLQ